MHSVQASRSRHNIFAKVDHDKNFVKAHNSPEKQLSTSTSLPSIDFHVRKKLANNDLAAKFSAKTPVMTVSSVLGRDGTGEALTPAESRRDDFGVSLFDYDEEEDNRSIKSNLSEHSMRLENFKRNLMAGPGGGDEVDLDELDDKFDDDFLDDASLTPSLINVDRVSISKQDPSQFTSPLDAHRKFVKAARSKNHIQNIKGLSSKRALPSTKSLLKMSTKSAASMPDDGSVSMSEMSSVASSRSSSVHSSSFGGNKGLGGKKASSFLFLSSFKSHAAPTILEEKENEDEDITPPRQLLNQPLQADTSSQEMPMSSPSAKAPLETTTTPVVPKSLKLRSFARFNPAVAEDSQLLLRTMDTFQQVPPAPANSSPTTRLEEDNPAATTAQSSSFHLFAASGNNPPQLETKRSLYNVTPLQEVKNKKGKSFTDWIDDKIRALTFVEAPPKPATPPPEEIPPMTVESLFGENLIRAPVSAPTTNGKRGKGGGADGAMMSDETYHRILQQTQEQRLVAIRKAEQEASQEAATIQELERDYQFRSQYHLRQQLQEQEHGNNYLNDFNDDASMLSGSIAQTSARPQQSSSQPQTPAQQYPYYASDDDSYSLDSRTNIPNNNTNNLQSNNHNNSRAQLPKLDFSPLARREPPPDPIPHLFSSSASFASSISSRPSLFASPPPKSNSNSNKNNSGTLAGTRLPAILSPTAATASSSASLFRSPGASQGNNPAAHAMPAKEMDEEKERIVYHDPFSTMFAYTSDDIRHYSSALSPQTQANLSRMYQPPLSKVDLLEERKKQHQQEKDVRSIFDIDDDIVQPFQATNNTEEEFPVRYQHSTTSYVLRDHVNYAALGVPDVLPVSAAAAATAAESAVEGHNALTAGPKESPPRKPVNPFDVTLLTTPAERKALLERKLTLEDIDTTYQSVRHTQQMAVYSTTAQQDLKLQQQAQPQEHGQQMPRVHSILNPGPHEAVIFLPPDHASFAAEMQETYHSLPRGLLAFTQDAARMQASELAVTEMIPADVSTEQRQHMQKNSETTGSPDGTRIGGGMQPLAGSRIFNLHEDGTGAVDDPSLTTQQQRQQANYAHEYAEVSSYLQPGIVLAQPSFTQVRDQLHPVLPLPSTASSTGIAMRNQKPLPQQPQPQPQPQQKPQAPVVEYAQYNRQQQRQKASRKGDVQEEASLFANDAFFRAIPMVDDNDDESVYTRDSFQRSVAPKKNNGTNVDRTAAASSYSLHNQQQGSAGMNAQATPSMLDLRAEILHFMAKNESRMTSDYAEYLDPQLQQQQQQPLPGPFTNQQPSSSSHHHRSQLHLTNPSAPLMTASHRSSADILQQAYASSNASFRPGSGYGGITGGGSVTSAASHTPSLLPEDQQHVAKLWDHLRSRYAGDREGLQEMQQKVQEYVLQGIKEENQIMKSYLEEIEDW